MKALIYDGELSVQEIACPVPGEGEILVKVKLAAICNTDHEITRGYVPGFRGIPGHEFFGFADGIPELAGKRVTAEINCACGECEFCKSAMGRHCPNRSVIGIINRSGAFAEYIAVPRENIVIIPPEIPDTSAIFIEPLAAALEILEQVDIRATHRVLVLGDGKLGQLIARALFATGCSLVVAGKHASKCSLLAAERICAVTSEAIPPGTFDIIVEASGSPRALELGLSLVKPRGTIVLKSTYAGSFPFNPSNVVVNEIALIGSRCGRFSEAIRFLEIHKPDLSKLISKTFKLENAVDAFAESQKSGSLKVILDCT